GEPLDLESVGIAIAALRLGDAPGIAQRWHDATPDQPGPWFWSARLQELKDRGRPPSVLAVGGPAEAR
ncbi:MAG: hypothetical protein JWM31_2515, partial [Solirubrobacterales bacterium]|nr:hypothetical protein [Solirubrobacterales bacterium]